MMHSDKSIVLIEQPEETGQDRAVLFTHEQSTIILLADGARDPSGGGNAAQSFIDLTQERIMQEHYPVDSIELEEFARQINKDICSSPKAGGECTGIAIMIQPDQIVGFSVGNSQAWIYTDEFKLELTSYQSRRPLFGQKDATPIAFGPFSPTGKIFVASDGFLNYASKQKTEEIVRNTELQSAPSKLANLVRLRTGQLLEDLSIVIYNLD